MNIGVLAVQGDFAEHRKVLEDLGATVKEVRTPGDLEDVSALVIPGGESTVMMKLLCDSGLDRAITERVQTGRFPVFGTCAGAILLSDSHLKLMDITVDRNAYGSQIDSFDAVVEVANIGPLDAAFIRAPKITRTGKAVEVLARHVGTAVIVREGKLLATTCHPEVKDNAALHRYFLSFL